VNVSQRSNNWSAKGQVLKQTAAHYVGTGPTLQFSSVR